jgi:hypothetical protein
MTLRYAKLTNTAVRRMLESRSQKDDHHQTVNKDP